MLAAAMLLPFASQAQTSWTVADGTTVHSKVPLDFYNCDGTGNRQAQMLYPASLLTDMSGSTIGSITFYHQNTSATKTVSASTWYIRMGETTETDLSSGLSTETLTTVYSGILQVTNGVFSFELTTPYTYNGGNLIVEIQTSGATGNYFGSSNQGCYGVDNIGSTYSTMSTPNYTAFVPKITFTELPSCFPVNNLAINATQTTSSSLTLTWTDDRNSGASYDIYTVTPTDTTLLGSSTTTTYTATGLNANTAYVFGVKSNCGGGDLAEMRTVSGRTACAAIAALPYTMGFEDADLQGTTNADRLPFCWTRINTLASGTYTYYPYAYNYGTPHGGSRHLYFSASSYGTYADTTGFIMPELDVTTYPMNGNRVIFWAKVSSTPYTVLVGTMTDPTDRSTFTLVESVSVTATSYTKYAVSLASAAATDAYVAFIVPKVTSTMYIDDVTLEELPSCGDVTGLTFAGTTSSTATLLWNTVGGAMGYTVYNMADSSVLGTATDTTYTVENLDANTVYTFGVQSNCSGGDGIIATASGRTACATEAMPWSENFDNWTAKSPCWSFLSGLLSEGNPTAYTSAWTLTSSYGDYIALSGKALGMNLYSQNRYWAVTPAISITSDNAVLSVDVAVALWSGATPNYDDNDTLAFLATTDGGATWTVLQTYNGTQLNAFGNEYTTLIVPIPSDYYGMDVRFAIYGGSVSGTSPHDNRFVFDNVSVDEAPDCLPVAGLAVSNVAGHTATLTWSGTAGGYTIWDMSDTTVYEYATDTTVDLYALDPVTAYTFGVTANCGAVESDMRTVSFTTTVSCPAPTALTDSLTPGDGTVATLSWHEVGEAAEWQLCLNNDSTNLIALTDTVYDMTGLTPEQAITAKVRAICGVDDTSAWSSEITFTPTNAFSITVNEGTITNSYVPVYGNWVDNHIKSQFIIPAADLSAIQWGSITKLTFHSSDANKNWGAASFEVYMTETTDTTVNSLAAVSDMTQVYTGSLGIVNNVMEITLTTPYQYMGGNLMIAFEQPTSGTYSNCNWYGMNATGASMGGYGTSVSQRNFLPKTTIAYLPGEEPSCLPVSGLAVSGITVDEATLTWTGDASSYNVYVLTATDTTYVENVSDTTVTLSGLTAMTQYTYGVTASCGSDESDIRTVVFTTACATVVVDEDNTFRETFNSLTAGIPACWDNSEGTTSSESYKWNYYATGHEGAGLRFDSYYNSNNNTNFLATPQIQLGIDARLSFWYKNPTAGDFSVLVSTDGGTTRTTIASGLTGASDWTLFTYDFDADTYTGQTVIVYFKGTSNYGSGDAYIYLDDVTVGQQPSCLAVTNLAVVATETTSESITLSWVSDGSNFTVLNMADTTEIGTTTDTFMVVNNLTPNTVYTFGVLVNCGGETSDTMIVSGRTACAAVTLPFTEDFENGIDCWSRVACHAGTQVVENTSSTTYAYSGTHAFKFRYNTNPPQYLISPEFTDVENGVQVSFMYKVGGNFTESFALGYSTTTNDVASFTWLSEQTGLTNQTYTAYTDYLPAGTKYVAVKYTANDQLALYIDSMVFSPMSANFCFPVTGLTVDSTTGSSVTLSWTGDAASYSIYNGTAYVGSTTDTFYTVSGLTAVTTYTFGVTAVCSATDSADMVTVSATTGCAGESCLITIAGTDAYNDGWDGAMITVSQNGVTVGTFTVDAASNTATYSVCSGAPVTFSWTTSTYYESYPEDVSFTITDGGGATVHSLTDATNMTDGVFFTLADACPSCVAPVVTLDSVNTTTATISWTSTATSFNVYNGTTAVATGISANTYTFTGLTAGTAYTFGVEAICGAGDTSAIATVNAQTEFDCSDITTLPYNYGFEGALGCWTTVNGSADGQPWSVYTGTTSTLPHTGSYVASSWSWQSNVSMHADAWLISPKFVLPTVAAGDSLTFSWWEVTNASYPDSYSVAVSTTTNDTASFVTVRPSTVAAGTWTMQSIDLTAYAGQSVYVAFHHVAYDANFLFIDDVSLYQGAYVAPDPDTLTVTFAVANATMGTTNPAPGTYQYITGDTVRFSAVPNAGYHFVGWEWTIGTDVDTLGAEYISANFPANTFMSYGSMTFTALFEAGNPDSTTITYAVNDTTMGSINPAGTQTIYVGNTIQAEATANAGYELYAWVWDILVNGVSANRDTIFSDDVDFANPLILGALPQSVVDDGATITITALFQASTVADTYTVTVNVNNAAMGSVTGAPTAPVAENTVVTLTAVANTGYRFVNWSNGLTNETISITVVSDTTLTANFEAIPTYTVTTVVNPANSGSITGAPTTAVLEGSEVVLTAVPAAGYHFVNWSNGSTTATIQVTVTSDTTLTANFEANAVGTYTVAVNYDATMGTVTGIPTEAVTSGTEVTLTATANTGFHFVSWSTGATTETITITVTSDTVLSATFEADEAELFTITVSSADETMGTVTGGGQFHAGDQTTVMAVANDGYRFVRWSDGNTEAVRQITVTGDLTLVAYFESIDGIDDVEAGNVSIYSAESRIFVKGAENSTIYVYDVNGRVVRTQANATETVEFTVPGTGVYLVKVGNAPAKRVVVVR